MDSQGVFGRGRFIRWLSGSEKSSHHSPASLRKAIEREFLYRGISVLEIKGLTLAADHTAAHVEFYSRPLYRDERLKYKPWAHLFVEQVLEDTAQVLRTTWTHMPSLRVITLKVLRRKLTASDAAGARDAAEDTIVLLRATGNATRGKVLRASQASSVALLRQCEMRYVLDPRLGLRALKEECAPEAIPRNASH